MPPKPTFGRSALLAIAIVASSHGCGGGSLPGSPPPGPTAKANRLDAGAPDAGGTAPDQAPAAHGVPRWTGPFCSPDGWCWENPLPQGNSLHAVWGSGPGDVFAVGAAGTVLHYDGRLWSAQSSTTDETFFAVWGRGPSNVFATGSNCTVLHYDGRRWKLQVDSPLRDVNQVNAFAPHGDGKAVAVGHGAIFQFDGKRWSRQYRDDSLDLVMILEGVWSHGPRQAVAVGQHGEILHYDGQRWTRQQSGTRESLLAVGGGAADDLYAVGGGELLHYDGRQWSAAGDIPPLRDLWAHEEGFIAVGGSGGVIAHDGQRWTRQASGTDYWDLSAVWGSSPKQVFAVGDAGMLLEYDGSRWSEHSRGVRKHLNAVWSSPSGAVLAVGEDGTVLRRDGRAWTAEPSGTDKALRAIWGSSPSDVFAVGEGGTVAHFDGERWSAQASGTVRALVGVWGSSASDVWAVGGEGTVLRYDGRRWAALSSGTNHSLRGVWGSSGSDVFAVGDEGTVIHFDGQQWRPQASGTKRPLRGIWGSSPRHVLAAGGALLRYDGRAWTEIHEGPRSGVEAIWGSGPNDIHAVGPLGFVAHFDGRSWTSEDGGCEYGLAGVWGNGPDDVYVVGGVGTVLHRTSAGRASASSGASGAADDDIVLELASHCQGDPYQAKWVTFHPDRDVPSQPEAQICYLPGAGDSVELDLLGMRGCAQDTPTRLQQLMQIPQRLFIRTSGALDGHVLQVRARTERGEPCGGFCSAGWDPWRTLFKDRVWKGRVINFSRHAVLGKAKHHVELLLQVRDAKGRLAEQRLFSIHWPVSC